MNVSELNKRIKALGKRNAAITAEVQALGLACLMQVEEHGNTTPINDLVSALSRPQVKAFSEWALAYGKVKRASKADAEAGKFFAYDKTRETDIEGATENTWDSFAPEKAESVAKAFDLQAAVMAVLRKAAAAGQPQSQIDALAKAVGIDPAKAPKVIIAEDALM
jgi:hypothetical protein